MISTPLSVTYAIVKLDCSSLFERHPVSHKSPTFLVKTFFTLKIMLKYLCPLPSYFYTRFSSLLISPELSFYLFFYNSLCLVTVFHAFIIFPMHFGWVFVPNSYLNIPAFPLESNIVHCACPCMYMWR